MHVAKGAFVRLDETLGSRFTPHTHHMQLGIQWALLFALIGSVFGDDAPHAHTLTCKFCGEPLADATDAVAIESKQVLKLFYVSIKAFLSALNCSTSGFEELQHDYLQ